MSQNNNTVAVSPAVGVGVNIRRFVTKVELRMRHFSIVHKGVVYHVKHNGDMETILLANNHKWRDSYLMVVISNKDIDEKKAHELINYYVDAKYLMCERCKVEWSGDMSFRIDMENGRITRMVCARCDPAIGFATGFFDALEMQKSHD